MHRVVILGKTADKDRFARALARHVAERRGPVRLLDDDGLLLFPSPCEGACLCLDVAGERWQTTPPPPRLAAPVVLCVDTARVSVLKANGILRDGPFYFPPGQPEEAAASVAAALGLAAALGPDSARALAAEREAALLRGRVDKLERAAEQCESYRQQLLEIGRLIGCDHVGDGLVRCVATALQGGEA